MTKEELYAHPGWADCTFEGARRQVLRLGLHTTFREKLEWLEEMDELSQRFGQSRGACPMAAPAAKERNEAPPLKPESGEVKPET